MDLPDDMIHKITSFLLLNEIINTQITCKLFKRIVKLNTHEPLHYWPTISNSDKYSKYLKYFKSFNDPNKTFRLRHIKVLEIEICNQMELNCIIPLVKQYHKNIENFNCEIYFDAYESFNVFDNIMTNNLLLVGGFHDQLLKCTKRLELCEIKITNKMLQSLAKSQISELDIQCCQYDVTTDDINLREWKSLKICSIQHMEEKLINYFTYQPPNLFTLVLNLSENLSMPIQFGKSIKILSLGECSTLLKNFNYFFNTTGCQFDCVHFNLYEVEIMDLDMIHLVQFLIKFANEKVNDRVRIDDVRTEQAKIMKQKYGEKISIKTSWRGSHKKNIVDILLRPTN